MKKLMIIGTAAALALASGCATKSRCVGVDGMYVSSAGTIGIGSIEVMASPVGEETAMLKYEEDTAWLSPSTKTHSIKIQLTGTNSVEQVSGIVDSICKAFVPTAAILTASTNITETVSAEK